MRVIKSMIPARPKSDSIVYNEEELLKSGIVAKLHALIDNYERLA